MKANSDPLSVFNDTAFKFAVSVCGLAALVLLALLAASQAKQAAGWAALPDSYAQAIRETRVTASTTTTWEAYPGTHGVTTNLYPGEDRAAWWMLHEALWLGAPSLGPKEGDGR